MTSAAVLESSYSLHDLHRFRGGGAEFVYLPSSGGIFALNGVTRAVLDSLAVHPDTPSGIASALAPQGFEPADVLDAVEDLHAARAIRDEHGFESLVQEPPDRFPLQTLVLNVTNQCNLSCEYCYEFGEDKVATPEGKPKFMDFETAQASIDYLIRESQGRRSIHITFFGGETLMNFPLLKRAVEYARRQAEAAGVSIDFSLTTNATLLSPAIIDFLAENSIGVTVSIDGPKEMQDKFRVFSNGRGSYDIIAPKIRELLARHKTRPIAARVTMTTHAMDVMRIYRHLKDDMGFYEVGFAPVTSSPDRLYSIGASGLDSVLSQFTALAHEYLEAALRNEHHGFSNVSDTLAELHQGISKSHPCGAGLGLLGVGPSGDIAPCHRFVDSDQHKLGSVRTGIDHDKRQAFLDRGNVGRKYECQSCWARPLCAGGCHHEAFVRYGDTGHPNLHYCDWIRGWTDTCLEIYGTIAAKNPGYLNLFSNRKAES